ncbi:YrdB family protein [Leifsonia sp. A12D58]|uniref:YrdB family protein n=1 Tax=Leifsonia sp. A12D58 TaxID=3397674 RepID=UPI0039E061B3
MTSTPAHVKIGANDILRFILELFAFVSLGIWGFVAWPLPWPGILIGIGAPLFAILVWALFRSPKAVFKIDPFGKAIVEIFVFGAAAFAWWDLGQPIVAIVFALVATVSGVISGRKELS